MNSVDKNIYKIRRIINEPWKKSILIKDPAKWRMLCASMDVIEDAQLAVNDFFKQPDISPYNGGYLFLYGLLQAFFIQQDAVSNLHRALFSQGINWKKDHPSIYEVRELRNDAIGHPTSRKDKSFHFISRNSINKDSFQIRSYGEEFENECRKQNIKFKDIQQSQENVVSLVLEKINNKLEIDFMKHKKKFMGNTLVSFIPQNYEYYLSKIYEGIFSNDELASQNFNEVKRVYTNIKNGIIQRYGSIEALSGTKLLIEKIDYTLGKLEKWINDDRLNDNKDAEVFLDAFVGYFKELKKMISEIDDEFNHPT